jgi:hypothetical protein
MVIGIVGSNLARDVDVCLCFCVVMSCVVRGVCDGLVTLPKESYHMSKYRLRNLKIEEAKARFGLSHHRKRNKCSYNSTSGVLHSLSP